MSAIVKCKSKLWTRTLKFDGPWEVYYQKGFWVLWRADNREESFYIKAKLVKSIRFTRNPASPAPV